MEYLIDTHVLLWMSGDDQNLSEKAKELLISKSNMIYISLISFWEIAIKHSSGKLELAISLKELLQFSIENNIEILPLTFKDFELIDNLAYPKHNGTEHRDPFDRILIAQAITNKLHIISCDEKFDMYAEVKRIW